MDQTQKTFKVSQGHPPLKDNDLSTLMLCCSDFCLPGTKICTPVYIFEKMKSKIMISVRSSPGRYIMIYDHEYTTTANDCGKLLFT